MPRTFHLTPVRRVGILAASCLAVTAVPALASASPVNLGTAAPFVVLGGSAVTNTGPSVLNGDLGVAAGTSLTGFDSSTPAGPGIVKGATHDDDAVAAQAQSDLTTAYNTAAGEAVPSANVLTGKDLGGMTLTPGNYSFSSSAQLTGTLTLNAQGNPHAQFVFKIGSTLTTASGSSVQIINGDGASACNVFWQVGSSATLGTTTAFEGNLLALTSVTLNTGSTVIGRALARNGAVTLDDNVLNDSACAGGSTTPTNPPHKPTHRGRAKLMRLRPEHRRACNYGFTATVKGTELKRVRFTLDGHWLANRVRSPFRVHVPASFSRRGVLRAHVTFKDATHAKTLTLRFRACSAAFKKPKPGPSKFTG